MLGFLAWVSSIFSCGSCFHAYTVAEIRGRPREFEHAGNVSGEGRANLADVSIGKAGRGWFEEWVMEKLCRVTG